MNHGLLLAALVAISLGALLKGMTGLGLPIFAVPALALIVSVEDAVILMIIPGIAANSWLVITHWRFRHLVREHLPFLATGFAGGLAGTGLLVLISDRGLKLLLVIWLGLYLVRYFTRQDTPGVFGASRKAAYPLGLAAGTVQGATGISAHIVAPYFHARQLRPEPYAFAVAFTFLLLAVAQLTASANLELLTAERIRLSLVALVPTLIFTWIGIRTARLISMRVFNRILLATFLVMEVKLIADLL